MVYVAAAVVLVVVSVHVSVDVVTATGVVYPDDVVTEVMTAVVPVEVATVVAGVVAVAGTVPLGSARGGELGAMTEQMPACSRFWSHAAASNSE